MDEFLAIAFAFPTVVFTVLAIVALVYWLFVLVGLLDMDVLGGDADLDGALPDTVEPGAELPDAGGEASEADADADATSGGALAALLSALRLRHAPLTVTLSVLSLVAWVASFFGARYAAPLVPGPDAVGGLLTLIVSLLIAVPAASLLTRPLARVFRSPPARQNRDLVGKVVTVRVPGQRGGVGQALLDEGGSELLIRVRVPEAQGLERGAQVLVVSYDGDADTFEVEPMENVLGPDRAD